MKFLIFNLTVAAALVYLLTTDRGEFQRVAGSLHDAAGEIRTMTQRAVGQGRKLLDRTPKRGGGDAPGTGPRPAMAPPPPPPAIPTPRIREAAATGTTAAARPSRPAARPSWNDPAGIDPAVIDPRVAKRRDEILAGIALNPPGTKLPPEPNGPALKEGEPMMTPAQRRKELFSLAEEMELLYARTVGN